MVDLLLRPAATEDLNQLYDYIAERSGSAERALGYIRRIRTRCEMLLQFPESGRRRDDLRPNLRLIGFERRIVIAYMVLPSGDIEIGRVFYGGRDYETLLREEDS